MSTPARRTRSPATAARTLLALLLAGACTEFPTAAPEAGSRADMLVPAAAVLHVPGDHPSIQAALDAAEAGPPVPVRPTAPDPPGPPCPNPPRAS